MFDHLHVDKFIHFMSRSNVSSIWLHHFESVVHVCIINAFLCARASIAIARINCGNSVCPSVCHNPVPFGDQVR